MIIASLKAAGINVESKPLDYNGLVEARNSGNFDLVINNEVQIEQHALDLLRLHLPYAAHGGAGKNRNFASYENPDAWALVQQLDKTPGRRHRGHAGHHRQLQKIQLDGPARHPHVVQRRCGPRSAARSGPTGRATR